MDTNCDRFLNAPRTGITCLALLGGAPSLEAQVVSPADSVDVLLGTAKSFQSKEG